MNNAANNTTAAAITDNRPQTAAEIIGTDAAKFARDYGRPPHPGETCEDYIEHIKQTIANGIPEYTTNQVEYIINAVCRFCIETAAHIIENPIEFNILAAEITESAENHPTTWLPEKKN